MASMGNPSASAFYQHNDVLHAKPEDAEGKARLTEELKRRGNAAFKQKHMREADVLYSKAIEFAPSAEAEGCLPPITHTLYGNRSAARLTMGMKEEALADADKAIDFNTNWCKGHFRRAQALDKLERWDEAEAAMDMAVAAAVASSEKEGKSMQKQQAKLGVRIVAAKKKAAERPKPKPKKAAPPPPTFTQSSPAKPASASKSAAGSASKKKGGELRGYKTRADGSKTSYFDNELTDEAKALIGDITPKQIASPAQVEAKPKGEASAWNSAGTYEERSYTDWAKGYLPSLLAGVEHFPEGSEPVAVISTTEVKDLSGEATSPVIRGSRRYLFEFSFKVMFETVGKDGTVKGSITFPEVVSDDPTYETQVRFSSGPKAMQEKVRPHVGGLVEKLKAQLAVFAADYSNGCVKSQ